MAAFEVEKAIAGGYHIRIQGPPLGWKLPLRHTYDTIRCKTTAEVASALEHYFGDPWHDEDGVATCPLCAALPLRREAPHA